MGKKCAFLIVFVLVFVSIFSVMFQCRQLIVGMTLSADKFRELRIAIENSDEERFSAVMQEVSDDAVYVPRSLEEGRELLEFTDSYYLLNFSQIPMMDLEIHTSFSKESAHRRDVTALRLFWSNADLRIGVLEWRPSYYKLDDDSEFAFSLETSEGEEIAFYRNVSSDYTASVKNNATELIVTIDVYDDSIDEATLLSLLGEDPINYCTVRALTSDYKDDLSDVVFVDKPDVVRLLLWIALPVGVAVIGGAAVILLRRKKKKAVTTAE